MEEGKKEVEEGKIEIENRKNKIREEGKQKRNAEIAKNMKNNGMNIELISEITGLTEIEIKKIK